MMDNGYHTAMMKLIENEYTINVVEDLEDFYKVDEKHLYIRCRDTNLLIEALSYSICGDFFYLEWEDNYTKELCKYACKRVTRQITEDHHPIYSDNYEMQINKLRGSVKDQYKLDRDVSELTFNIMLKICEIFPPHALEIMKFDSQLWRW